MWMQGLHGDYLVDNSTHYETYEYNGFHSIQVRKKLGIYRDDK